MLEFTTEQKKLLVEMSLKKIRGESNLDWEDIVDCVQANIHKDTLRRWARGMDIYDEYLTESKENNSVTDNLEKINSKILELKRLKVSISDERRYVNAKIRELERLDDFCNKAKAKYKEVKSNPINLKDVKLNKDKKEALLILSDWHYGLLIDNELNAFNSEIAIQRVSNLIEKTIDYCKLNDIEKITVFSLGDLISSEIHTILKIENRENLVEQIYEVSSLLANALKRLSEYFLVDVYFSFGNHERTGIKDLSLTKDNFTILIEKYVMKELSDNKKVYIHGSRNNSDIVYCDIKGYGFVGVHGHLEKKPISVNLSNIIHKKIDYICLGHFHSQGNYFENGSEIFINGSLCGTDEYAYSKRLFSPPSQKLLIINEDGVDCIYNIKVS